MANNISEDGMMDDLAAKGILHPSQGRKWRWVSRDKSEREEFVDVWANKEKPSAYVEFGETIFGGARYASICHAELLALTGIDIKPGQCVRVEFTAKVLEDAS